MPTPPEAMGAVGVVAPPTTPGIGTELGGAWLRLCKSLPGVTTDAIAVSGVMLMNCMISSMALGSVSVGKP